MTTPYFFSACRMTWFVCEKPEISKLDFKRMRMPIGAALGSVELAAQWDAGGVKAARLCCSVKRIACLIDPAATSS